MTHELPPSTVIGCIGFEGSGTSEYVRRLGGFDYTFDAQDAVGKLGSEAEVEALRRAGKTVFVASHDLVWLSRIADEVWWIDAGSVRQKGDPGEVLRAYAKEAAERYRASAPASVVAPSMRRGDGRAEIVDIQTLNFAGAPVSRWQSGETVSIRLTIRFAQAVDDPVVGIMIRTRIGMEVYGTNTELENLKLGPQAAGDVLVITFTFECHLCPQHYTITAASHDPDGVWHDWLEDAVAITVADTRYTAGVANLRARVSLA
jgi:lipopolysaccharide transport system ATP-binding protein